MWDLVALQFPDRTKGQIKSFFYNVMKPTLEVGDYKQNMQWNSRDDRQLAKLVKLHGKKWKKIKLFMEMYSTQQLKLRYFYLQR